MSLMRFPRGRWLSPHSGSAQPLSSLYERCESRKEGLDKQSGVTDQLFRYKRDTPAVLLVVCQKTQSAKIYEGYALITHTVTTQSIGFQRFILLRFCNNSPGAVRLASIGHHPSRCEISYPIQQNSRVCG